MNQGASVLHVHYITPLLHKHENAIDSVLEESIKKVQGVSSLPLAVLRSSLTMWPRCDAGRSYFRRVPHTQRAILPGASRKTHIALLHCPLMARLNDQGARTSVDLEGSPADRTE